MKQQCDLFGNGGEGECGGPMFSDPLPEVDLKVCAFHALMNRNYWMNEAETGRRTAVIALGMERERREEADRLVSVVHDLIYAEPFDRKAASDAVWKVHEVLRGETDVITDGQIVREATE